MNQCHHISLKETDIVQAMPLVSDNILSFTFYLQASNGAATESQELGAAPRVGRVREKGWKLPF